MVQIRRVVTGQLANGASVFVSDDLLADDQFGQLWGSDDAVALPTDGAEPTWSGFFPPTRGFRFLVWALPAGPIAVEPAALDAVNEKFPGLLDAMEFEHPGMHTTDTIDFDIVLSGEVYLELDDGAEVKRRRLRHPERHPSRVAQPRRQARNRGKRASRRAEKRVGGGYPQRHGTP